MKRRTIDLTGAALDWAVARVFNIDTRYNAVRDIVTCADDGSDFSPSLEWECGGPIIEATRITVVAMPDGSWATSAPAVLFHQPAPLLAAMRSLVKDRLGDEVDIPSYIPEKA